MAKLSPQQALSVALDHHRSGRLAEAEAIYRQVLNQLPDNPEALHFLGVLLGQKNQFKEAVEMIAKAISIDSTKGAYYSNLGSLHRRLGRLDKALAACQRAVELTPDTETYTNLGAAYSSLGEVEKGIAACRQAISLNPKMTMAHWNLSLMLLKDGQFAEGWKEHEWRRAPRSPLEVTRYPQPQWQGEDISGKTILLHAEFGLGDSMQFVRYVPMVAQRAGRTILGCPPALARLFSISFGYCADVTTEQNRPFDLHCPLPSLPGVFQTDLRNMPSTVPYLASPSTLVSEWAKRLGPAENRLRVGLAWAGKAEYSDDLYRSIPLSRFGPLGSSRVQFHSLQKGPPAAECAKPPKGMDIVDHSEQLTDFAETAALIQNLDIVISVDTAVAHLAGALGKPTWVLLPWNSDWRWLMDRDDSPWYPTMRLFRQTGPRAWPAVIQRVVKLLHSL